MSALDTYLDKYIAKEYGEKLPSDCVTIDVLLNKVTTELAKARLNEKDRRYIVKLENVKLSLEKEFLKKACRDEFERTRIKSTGESITAAAIKQEQEILGKTTTEQWIYIGISAITIVGIIVVLMRKK